MAAVEVQTRLPATAGVNGWDTTPTIDIADPDMTRAARQARAAWRRKHLEAWQRELKALYHFDPEFIYDPAHEYNQESTTDPDYGAEGVHFLEFDADGVVSPLEKRARKVQERSAGTSAAPLAHTDLKPDYEVEVRFRPETVARVNQATRASHPVKKGVRPDMLIRTAMSVSERERFMPKGVLRLDLGAPVPPLVLEVVSEGSANRDLNYKKHLYAAAGVSEYLVYDLGGKRRSRSPRELLMYRLEGGSYRQAPVADEYWSDVFGTYVRFQPDARENDEEFRGVPEEERSPPRFQWWDPDTERWRDRETDAEVEREDERKRHAWDLQETRTESLKTGEARGRAQERMAWAVNLLHRLLSSMLAPADLDLIETAWHRNGPPADVMDCILAAHETPDEWRDLLLPGNLEDDGTPDPPPEPREPKPPLGT